MGITMTKTFMCPSGCVPLVWFKVDRFESLGVPNLVFALGNIIDWAGPGGMVYW